ncbi:uncharacterized protein LOC126881806 [Diabrotica virgifera virgifera]|uniref:CHK kinase-like domain-containing protein n=1 Tax=Diabrotica virgifera virgifera TaxID=50390 RepID=A0ABM5JWM7_DIAVI|nr:uncharacterized protein LOC126881806 [Diabrotica virgifera virgifera]
MYVCSKFIVSKMSSVEAETIGLVAKAFSEEPNNIEIIDVKGNDIGRGYSSEVLFIFAKNKRTGSQRRFIIKQALPDSNGVSSQITAFSFHNEKMFYLTVFPALINFQKLHNSNNVFNNMAECYGAITEPSKEKLIFEDLTFQGYEIFPSTEKLLDTSMYEVLFKVYGRLHGISYAFKHYQKEKFFEMKEQFRGVFQLFIEQDKFIGDLENVIERVERYLKEENEIDASKKLKIHKDNCKKILMEALEDRGPNIVFIHGDAWSNNILYKYDDKRKLEDIKIIDFQVSNIATPIIDISYSFYTGASPEALDNLDHLHQVYYKSVTDTLKQYGCNPQEILTYKAFKEEWKKYVLYGLLTGLIIWSIKCTDKDKGATNVGEYLSEECADGSKSLFNPNEERFKKVSLALIRHFQKYDFL